MNNDLLILWLGLALLLTARPQSVGDLNAKYPAITSYEIRPGILMTPNYTDDGQVCRMSIERQRATRSGVMLDSFMSDKLMKEIEDELAPRSDRGKNLLGGSDDNAVLSSAGGISEEDYGYENIGIEVMKGPNRERVLLISWVHRKCKEEPKPIPLEQYPH